jgi:flagellar hook-length control protein FliK
MLNLHAFIWRHGWPDDCRTARRKCDEVKNVPTVEPQTSAAKAALNVNARNSRYSPAASAQRDSKQFSDLLDQTASSDDGRKPSSSGRSDRAARDDNRTAAPDTKRDSDAPASDTPTADQQQPEPSRAASEPAVAAPNKDSTTATPPAKPEKTADAEAGVEDQGASTPDASAAAAVAVPVTPVVPPQVPPATVAVNDVVEQAPEAAAVAAAASGSQAPKPLPTDHAAGDDKAADDSGAVPADAATGPAAKSDKPVGTAGQAAPAAKPETHSGTQEAVPAQAGKADGTRAAPQEAPQAPQHEARTAKPASGSAEAATDSVNSGPRHDPQATSHAGLEPLQTIGAGPLTPAAAANAAASAPNATSQTPAAAIPIASVAVEIATRAQAGNNRFEIRLDPPELGRIDVTLDVDRHGNVTSHLVVERSQTLDLLRRDAPQLERALNDAGLKTGDSAMQFSLRDQGSNADRDPRPTRLPPVSGSGAQSAEPAPVTAVRNYRWSGTVGGVDIRV